MIAIDFTTAFLIYLAITLSAIFGLWFSRGLSSRRWHPGKREIVIHTCEFCCHKYAADAEKISRCPACQLLNQKKSGAVTKT